MKIARVASHCGRIVLDLIQHKRFPIAPYERKISSKRDDETVKAHA